MMVRLIENKIAPNIFAYTLFQFHDGAIDRTKNQILNII